MNPLEPYRSGTWGTLSNVLCVCGHIADEHGGAECVTCLRLKIEQPCKEFRRVVEKLSKVEDSIPKKGEWFEWHPCPVHQVVQSIVIERWSKDASEYPLHAAKCRECLSCCLFPMNDGFKGFARRILLKLCRSAVVRARTE